MRAVGDIPFTKMGKAECELCRVSGLVAVSISGLAHRCVGPVPEGARGVYEEFCTCVEGKILERLWPKVDWKAGDRITIELTEREAMFLNYQHGMFVSLDNAKIISPEGVHVR